MKGKHMKKIKYILSLVLVLGLVLLMPLAAHAEEVKTPEVTDAISEAPEASSDTIGENLLALLEAYAGELLATITLAVSLFNTYRYQKGLVPMLYRGLKNVAGAAANATDSAKASADKTQAELEAFVADMRPLMARMLALCEGAEAIAKEAETLKARIEEGELDREDTKRWMRGVADMLYRVFTSANLPQYAKDAIGAEYLAITQAAEVSAYAEQSEGKNS
jgi:hypothetical protein